MKKFILKPLDPKDADAYETLWRLVFDPQSQAYVTPPWNNKDVFGDIINGTFKAQEVPS